MATAPRGVSVTGRVYLGAGVCCLSVAGTGYIAVSLRLAALADAVMFQGSFLPPLFPQRPEPVEKWGWARSRHSTRGSARKTHVIGEHGHWPRRLRVKSQSSASRFV